MIAIGIVKKFGELISEAESQVIQGISEGRIETEPSITDRFLDRIEQIVNEYPFDEQTDQGVVFKTRTLRDRGRNAPEAQFGADFCGVLNIQLEGFKVRKGFLSQAKREGHGISVHRGFYGLTTVKFRQNIEFDRLCQQTNDMLSITPDSFVIVYGRNGFVVVPASSVQGLETEARLYGKSVSRFFKEYLMSFIGDPRLKAWDDNSLEALRKETRARTAIMFDVSSTTEKSYSSSARGLL